VEVPGRPGRAGEDARPEEKTITTLFCDLRNYSLFASTHASELLKSQREIANALNVMASAITDRDGVVGGFRGDAVLGFWGWPKLQDGQVARAARAAVAIAGRLNDYTRTGRCGVAITHGTAVAGRLGAHDLAVVDLYGPVVNLTFRLEAMTKAFGVPIIVSEEVAREVAEVDPYGREMRTRPLGRVRAKGFPEPVPAFELYSAQLPSVPDWLQEQWADAVTLFTDGKWDAAAGLLNDQFPGDPAGQCLLRVMDATKRKVPPELRDKDGLVSFAPPAKAGSE
jgi:class 3 adenylate cyclase